MDDPEIEIREATIHDLDTLKLFEQGVVQYERAFAPNLKKDPIVYYDLVDLIQRADAQVIVALLNNKIVGSGYALVKSSAPYKHPDKYAYLGFMFVVPEFRGRGVNGIIIDHLIQWTKNRGLIELQLDVYAENEMAIRAYVKRNFKPDLLKMRLRLEE